VDAACRFIVVDADDLQIARVEKEKGERVLLSAIADADQAANGLIERTALRPGNSIRSWRKEVDDALAYRPPEWPTLRGAAGKVHPFELCQAVVPILERHPRAVLICDGGEIGQWPQSVLKPSRRIINGVAGSIGSSIPFAVAARAVEPDAPIIAIMGDGTFGFHMAEFDTAVRYGLPFVAIVGNDATWNAEYQIQVREYGSERARGCELLPARYDLIVSW
jgi:acetolactate synthase-1/2/3 large subunit